MFYHFCQNNSGGSFRYNDALGITEHVVIEANSADEANEKAEQIDLYFDGCLFGDDCSCCGIDGLGLGKMTGRQPLWFITV
jgi:hypothetical protein